MLMSGCDSGDDGVLQNEPSEFGALAPPSKSSAVLPADYRRVGGRRFNGSYQKPSPAG
jgi:hypothetical protein